MEPDAVTKEKVKVLAMNRHAPTKAQGAAVM